MSPTESEKAIKAVVVSSDADFPALLRAAIDLEQEQCNEKPPDSKRPASLNVLSANVPEPQRSDEFEQLERRCMQSCGGSEPQPSQSRQHKKRRIERIEDKLKRGYYTSIPTSRKHLKNAEVVKTDLDAAKLPVASGACAALNKPAPQRPKEAAEIEELLQAGFQRIKIGRNEKRELLKSPIVIADRNGLIIALVAGAPEDTAGTRPYSEDAKDLFKIIIDESNSEFTLSELNHSRGDFPAVNFGFTFPYSAQRPLNLNTHHHQKKIEQITGSAGFKRISAFQNSAFAFWNPGVYKHQKLRVEKLLAHDRNLKRTSPTTIFPTTACNFRNVCCYKHRDTHNCPYGWCAITALGDFNHERGGHIILWELKLVIEFPHSYTIFIPSATITHSNIPVADGDVRVSITQYCAGSIFRYVDNGFRTDKALRKQDRKKYEAMRALKKQAWKTSLSLLSTVKDILG